MDEVSRRIKRLEYLAGMIAKYAYRSKCEGGNSNRVYGWCHEYDDIKDEHQAVWRAYCVTTNRCPDHDSRDCMA